MLFPYSFPAPIDDEVSERLLSAAGRGVQWLRENQNDDGSWGSAHPLDQVIASCHAVMALVTSGFAATDERLLAGVRFLTSDAVTRHQWGFWRVAPLMRVPEQFTTTALDMEVIERHVRGHSGPAPDQLLEVFYLKCLAVFKEPGEADYSKLVNRVLEQFTPETAWADRADTSAHVLAVLETLAPSDLTEEHREAVLRLIRARAQSSAGGQHVHWEARVSSTAYVVMNCLECSLSADEKIMTSVDRAIQWIVAQQKADGSWPVEPPPYGGDNEIVGAAYYTAVPVRALAAYVRSTGSGTPQAIRLSATALGLRTERNALNGQIAEIGGERETLMKTVESGQKARSRLALLATVMGGLALAASLGLLVQLIGLPALSWKTAAVGVVAALTVVVLFTDAMIYSRQLFAYLRKRIGRSR